MNIWLIRSRSTRNLSSFLFAPLAQPARLKRCWPSLKILPTVDSAHEDEPDRKVRISRENLNLWSVLFLFLQIELKKCHKSPAIRNILWPGFPLRISTSGGTVDTIHGKCAGIAARYRNSWDRLNRNSKWSAQSIRRSFWLWIDEPSGLQVASLTCAAVLPVDSMGRNIMQTFLRRQKHVPFRMHTEISRFCDSQVSMHWVHVSCWVAFHWVHYQDHEILWSCQSMKDVPDKCIVIFRYLRANSQRRVCAYGVLSLKFTKKGDTVTLDADWGRRRIDRHQQQRPRTSKSRVPASVFVCPNGIDRKSIPINNCQFKQLLGR